GTFAPFCLRGCVCAPLVTRTPGSYAAAMTGGVVASFGDVVARFVGLGILGLSVWLVVDWLRRLGRRWRDPRQGPAAAADTAPLGGVEDGEFDDHVRSVLR